MLEQSSVQDTLRSPINLGVVGCGKHSLQSHLSKMDKSAFVTLGAVYDPSDRVKENLAQFSLAAARILPSEEELLLSPVEAVFIMSPDEFHAGSLQRAVRAGKHVFVEKPLAVDSVQLEIAADALRHAKEQGLTVSSCHPRRFDPPFVWLKENLPALTGEFGTVLSFEFDFSYHRPSKDWKQHRGLLLDHANHEIDLVHWYFGHAPFKAWRLIDNPWQYQVCGVRDDGIRFSFNGTRRLEARKYREFTAVRFERGLLFLDATQGIVTINDHENGAVRSHAIQGTDYDTRFRLVNENFIQAVQGCAESYLTSEDLYVNTAFSVRLTERESWEYLGSPMQDDAACRTASE